MRVAVLLIVLFLSLITPTYSIGNKVISKDVTYFTLTGIQQNDIKNYITNLDPEESCEFKDSIFRSKIMYNFPPDNVPNIILLMRMRNLVVPSRFQPYSNYDNFEFVDNLDGTFNVTAPMPMADLIPSKCSFQESSDPITRVTILDYTCLIELIFVPPHDPGNPYLINFIYMSITLNGEDKSILAFGAEIKVNEICPPASCTYIDSIATKIYICQLNDCTQEKNSTALIYGQDFQMIIQVVDPALKDAFQMDLKLVQLKFANQNVDLTNLCHKLCNDAGLPCKPGYFVVQCPVMHTGSMVMMVTSKISPVNSIGRRLLKEEGKVKETELIRSSRMLEICLLTDEDYDECIYNNDVPRHEYPYKKPKKIGEPDEDDKTNKEPDEDDNMNKESDEDDNTNKEPDEVDNMNKEPNEDDNTNLVIGLGVMAALLACFIIALSLYIYLKKIYKNKPQIPRSERYACKT